MADYSLEQLLALDASRRVSERQHEKTILLRQINRQLLSDDELEHLRKLQRKRKKTELSQAEYDQLTALTDKMEVAHAKRIKALGEMARKRGVTLEEIMAQLEITLPDYV